MTDVSLSAAPPAALTAADRPWLKSYPPGVPANIDPGAYRSLVELMEQSFKTVQELNRFRKSLAVAPAPSAA